MKLILIRHAKSSWDHPGLNDHDRPLNTRGRSAAARIGAWLSAGGHRPDVMISSTATRCVETWERLSVATPWRVPSTFTPALYHAGAVRMLEVLRRAQGGCVLMLGHNPGIGDFADTLVETPPPHADFARYPTAATLVAEFPISAWSDLALGSGHVQDFVVPRDLA